MQIEIIKAGLYLTEALILAEESEKKAFDESKVKRDAFGMFTKNAGAAIDKFKTGISKEIDKFYAAKKKELEKNKVIKELESDFDKEFKKFQDKSKRYSHHHNKWDDHFRKSHEYLKKADDLVNETSQLYEWGKPPVSPDVERELDKKRSDLENERRQLEKDRHNLEKEDAKITDADRNLDFSFTEVYPWTNPKSKGLKGMTFEDVKKIQDELPEKKKQSTERLAKNGQQSLAWDLKKLKEKFPDPTPKPTPKPTPIPVGLDGKTPIAKPGDKKVSPEIAKEVEPMKVQLKILENEIKLMKEKEKNSQAQTAAKNKEAGDAIKKSQENKEEISKLITKEVGDIKTKVFEVATQIKEMESKEQEAKKKVTQMEEQVRQKDEESRAIKEESREIAQKYREVVDSLNQHTYNLNKLLTSYESEFKERIKL